MKKAATNLPASVRQRLLNLANENRQDFGMLSTKFALERFLYRLSVSPHRDNYVLKGALLLQLWTSEEADTIRIEKIRDEEAYEGIRVLLEARLANARIPLQIDVGFGDVITPTPVEVEYRLCFTLYGKRTGR